VSSDRLSPPRPSDPGSVTPGTREPSALQATVIFGLLTVALTWPQAARLSSIPDHTDVYFSLWRLAWIAHQLPIDPLRLFDANIYFPAPRTLAYSDATLLQGLIGAPFIWLGVPVVVVYNLLVLASFVLCGTGTFLLVRHLTGRGDVAILGGIVFAFGAFRFDHYIHLELLWAQWMPFTLFYVHRTLDSGRLRDGLITGACAAAVGLSCVYYTVFFATALVFATPAFLSAVPHGRRRQVVMALAAGGLLAGLVLAPYFVQYLAVRTDLGDRPAGTAVLYAAGPKHFLATLPGNLLYGKLTGSIGRHEKFLFPGFAALALLAVALCRRPDRIRIGYLVLLLVAMDLSFGHRGPLYGFLREHLAVYRGLRAPARAGHVALLAIAVLAGMGAARMSDWLHRTRPRLERIGILCLGVLMVSECLMAPSALVAVATKPGEVYRWLREQPAGVVAEFPMSIPPFAPSFEAQFEFQSAFHWHPLANGYSGATSPAYNRLIREVADFPSDGALAALRATGVSYLIVHEKYCAPGRYAALTDVLNRRADLTNYGPFDEDGFAVRAYRFSSGAPQGPPSAAFSTNVGQGPT